MHPFYRHVNHFNFSVGGKYFHNVILGHIPNEPPNMYFGGFRGRAPPFPLLFISFRWFGFGTEGRLLSC
jgi:hypothetical protein